MKELLQQNGVDVPLEQCDDVDALFGLTGSYYKLLVASVKFGKYHKNSVSICDQMSNIEQQLKDQSIGTQQPISVAISKNICDTLRQIPENILLSLIVRNEIASSTQYEAKLANLIDEIDALVISSKCLSVNLNYVFSQLCTHQLSSFEQMKIWRSVIILIHASLMGATSVPEEVALVSQNRYEDGLPAAGVCVEQNRVDLPTLFYSMFCVQSAMLMLHYLGLRLTGAKGRECEALEAKLDALSRQVRRGVDDADVFKDQNVLKSVGAIKIFGGHDARQECKR